MFKKVDVYFQFNRKSRSWVEVLKVYFICLSVQPHVQVENFLSQLLSFVSIFNFTTSL